MWDINGYHSCLLFSFTAHFRHRGTAKVALRKSHEESLQQRLALMEGEMKLVPSGLPLEAAGSWEGRMFEYLVSDE